MRRAARSAQLRPQRVAASYDHLCCLRGYRRVALLDDPLLRHVSSDELTPDAAPPEDDHAVAERSQLLVVGARAHHVHSAILRRGADQLVDLLPGTDVDALRRLVEQK